MKNTTLIQNAIQTPDGTILISTHRHDFKSHIESNGECYMVDGGNEYLRRSVNPKPVGYTDLTLYLDDPAEVVQDKMLWGTYGKDGNEPLKYVFLKDCEKAHLEKILLQIQSKRNIFEAEVRANQQSSTYMKEYSKDGWYDKTQLEEKEKQIQIKRIHLNLLIKVLYDLIKIKTENE